MFSWTAFRSAVSVAAASALVRAYRLRPPAASGTEATQRPSWPWWTLPSRVSLRPAFVRVSPGGFVFVRVEVAVKSAVNRGPVRFSQLSD